MATDDERPVLSGLVALVAVAVALGLFLALGVLLVTRVAGLGGGDSTSGAGGGPTMYLPPPEKTASESAGPLVEGPGPESKSASQAPKNPITLSAAQAAVAPMQQIDLSGDYPSGDGAILQVQRLEGGSWSDFPVTAAVSGGSFTTYVQTGQSGKNTFRVIDNDSGKTSNKVTVRVG